MQQDGDRNTICSSRSSLSTTKDKTPWWYLPFSYFIKPATPPASSLASSRSSINKKSASRRGSIISTPPSSRTSINTTPCTCQGSVSSITPPSSPPPLEPETHTVEQLEPILPFEPILPSPPLTPASSAPSPLLRKNHQLGRKKPPRERESGISTLLIPPYSPTYCRPNEFPYSNFYLKLPNGRWMIRYRSGTRLIIGTDVLDGYMI